MSNINTIFTTSTEVLTGVQNNNQWELLQNQLRELAQERLDANDIRLPVLPGAQDSDAVRYLNNSLNQEQIKSILQMIVNGEFDKKVIILLLSKIPQTLLNSFLDLRSEPLLYNYGSFINLLLYASGAGILDIESSINVLNELIVNLITPNIENLDIQERIENATNTSNESIENNNNSNSALNRRLNSFSFFNFNWRSVARNSLLLIGSGIAFSFAQPWVTPLLSLAGARLLTDPTTNNAPANSIVTNNGNEQSTGQLIDSIITLIKNWWSK